VTEPEPTTTETYRPFPPFADWASAPVDSDTFDRFAAIIDDLRSQPDAGPLTRAVETATRAAAIDTGAIEGLYEVDRGFTMTVAVATSAWEAVIAAREPIVRRSFEDALRAYDFVLDLATTRTDVSEKAIREIHQLICDSQETYRVVTSLGWQERPLPKGEYKELPNNPTSRVTGRTHPYAPPIDVPAEMHRLVEELRTEAFAAAHPVRQAAYAHYALVAIHPFADGNGRVARALASVYLYRRPGVPLVIFADQKDEYLDALQETDSGRPDRFVRFVQERVVDVVGLVQVAAQAPERPVTSSIASLRDAMVGQHGLSHIELDALATRLLNAARDEMGRQVSGLDLPDGVSVQQRGGMDELSPDSTYRTVPTADRTEETALSAIAPAYIQVAEGIGVRVLRPDEEGALFQLVATTARQTLPVELREVFPAMTTVLELKIRFWVQGLVERLVAELARATRSALHQSGYL